jgi:hypothetical protein
MSLRGFIEISQSTQFKSTLERKSKEESPVRHYLLSLKAACTLGTIEACSKPSFGF